MSEESSPSKAPRNAERFDWEAISSTLWAAFAFFGPRLIIAPVVPLLMSLPFSSDARIFVLEAVIDILVLGGMVAVLKVHELPLASIGLAKLKPIYFGLALVTLPLYFICSLLAVHIMQLLFPSIDVTAQQQIGFTTTKGPELVLVFVALVIVPPVVEEIVFRGFLLRAYQRKLGAVAGSIVVSLLFALLHAPVVVSIDVFVLSLFLCYVRTRSNSLWPSIFLHSLKNFVAFLYLFIIGAK